MEEDQLNKKKEWRTDDESEDNQNQDDDTNEDK